MKEKFQGKYSAALYKLSDKIHFTDYIRVYNEFMYTQLFIYRIICLGENMYHKILLGMAHKFQKALVRCIIYYHMYKTIRNNV